MYYVAVFFGVCIFALAVRLSEMNKTINNLGETLSLLKNGAQITRFDEQITRFIVTRFIVLGKKDDGSLLMTLIEKFGLKKVQEFIGG